MLGRIPSTKLGASPPMSDASGTSGNSTSCPSPVYASFKADGISDMRLKKDFSAACSSSPSFVTVVAGVTPAAPSGNSMPAI